jgi:Signal transduction protein containing GAF and PtsI domains
MTQVFSQIATILSDLIVFDRLSLDQFLNKIIKLINKIIDVDSCFIYLYQSKKLTLFASKKSHKNLLGKITLKEGEGITGWVAEHKKTVAIKEKAYLDPRFKFVEELPEDRYEAFLSVPIIDKQGLVGVINLQNKKPKVFSKKEKQMIEIFASIIASGLRKVILQEKLGLLEEKLEERKIVEKAKGILMKKENLTEEEAYKKIQKEAMKKRKKLKRDRRGGDFTLGVKNPTFI